MCIRDRNTTIAGVRVSPLFGGIRIGSLENAKIEDVVMELGDHLPYSNDHGNDTAIAQGFGACSNVDINRVTVVGRSHPFDTTSFVGDNRNFKVRNCTFQSNARPPGTHETGGVDFLFNEIYRGDRSDSDHEAAIGIVLRSKYGRVEGNRIWMEAGTGVNLAVGTNVVKNNEIFGAAIAVNFAITLSVGKCEDTVISDNQFRRCWKAVNMSGAEAAHVINNLSVDGFGADHWNFSNSDNMYVNGNRTVRHTNEPTVYNTTGATNLNPGPIEAHNYIM